MDEQQQLFTKPNTKLEKKLLDQLVQGGVRESTALHPSHWSAPDLPNQERATTVVAPRNNWKGQPPQPSLVANGQDQKRKGRSLLHLHKIGEKILEKRSWRKKVKESVAVRQLCAKFPELEEDTICSAYAAHGGNKNLTINYLWRALESCEAKSTRHAEDTDARKEEELYSETLQDSQVATDVRAFWKNQVDTMPTTEKPVFVHRPVEKKSSVLVESTQDDTAINQTNKWIVESSAPAVATFANNMGLSRRRSSAKSKKYSDDQSKVESYSWKQGYSVDAKNSNRNNDNRDVNSKKQRQDSKSTNVSSRLAPEDWELLNRMPKNAKEAFHERMKKFHEEDMFFKEECGTSDNRFDDISVSQAQIRLEDNRRGEEQHSTESSRRQDNSEHISRFMSTLGVFTKEDYSETKQDDLEQSSSSSFRALERRLVEWNDKLQSDMNNYMIRLDQRYDNIHQLVDDLYTRVHQVECKLDEWKQTKTVSTGRPLDSYWSSSLWLLLDGIGFLLWYCLLKPIVLLYCLFYGKKQQHHRRHGSRDSNQFASGDLSKTLAFLINPSDDYSEEKP
ncbi:hypothetical protein GAYE_SCF15G3573 [Galdieria yellowstonensis]|uniref:Uncharacterized protein n=1 Tax=Galdieria yellowstonensis TaxID=3028027 RepID=A0AAV9IEB6_9RHOD|nr:hypothetical protein GAYE_SCF15G3573 [Galdieria yellowstonensis]